MSPTRNTPLTARSVLASVLLGTDPPWLPTPLLVRTTALFGISEGSTRTALSRLVAAGDAEAERRRVPARRPAGGPPAAAVGQPAGRHPALGRHLGAGHRRRRHPPGRRPIEPTSATRSAPCASSSSARACGAARTTSTRTARPTRPRWSARWCVRWTGARPDPAPDVASAFGLAGVGRRRPRRSGTRCAGLLRAARARRHRRAGATASSPRPPCCATSRPTRCSPTRSSRRLAGRRAPRGLRPLRRRLPRHAAGLVPRREVTARAPVADVLGRSCHAWSANGSPENDAAV